MLGDLAKGTERGGLFTVEDTTVEQERFNNREICYTGALPGYKIPTTKLDAATPPILLFFKMSNDMFI